MWKENISPAQVVAPGRMICWSAKWYGEPDVEFSAEWKTKPDKMVKRLHNLLSEADANVTYNGAKFDELVVNWEFAKYKLAPPAPSKSIDMYRVVSQKFRPLSKRMDYVAKELGLEGKLSTGGFELWAKVMEKDPDARKLMEEYNIQDIHVLEELYDMLKAWVPNHPNISHYAESGEHSCPSCASTNLQRRGTHKTKVSTFQRFQCQDCGAWSRKRLAERTTNKPEIVSL